MTPHRSPVGGPAPSEFELRRRVFVEARGLFDAASPEQRRQSLDLLEAAIADYRAHGKEPA